MTERGRTFFVIFVLLAFCVATVFDHPLDMKLEVQSSPEFRLLIVKLTPTSRRASLTPVLIAKTLTPRTLFPEVVKTKDIPAKVSRLRATPFAFFARGYLYPALVLAQFFGKPEIFRAALYSFETVGVTTMLTAPTFSESPLDRNRFFPQQMYAAAVGLAETPKIYSVLSEDSLIEFVTQGVRPVPALPLVFAFTDLRPDEFPHLQPMLEIQHKGNKASKLGGAAIDDSALAINYPSFGKRVWAYCLKDDERTACTHDLSSVFPEANRDRFRQLQTAARGTGDIAAIARAENSIHDLLSRCDRLNPKEAGLLHEMVFGHQRLRTENESTLPSLMSDCAIRLHDEKMLRYAEFMDRQIKQEFVDYVSADTFFSEITGQPGKSDSKINWYSDTVMFFRPDMETRMGIRARSIYDIDVTKAPSEKTRVALGMILTMNQRHLKNAVAHEFQTTLLKWPDYLNTAETEWIENALARMEKR